MSAQSIMNIFEFHYSKQSDFFAAHGSDSVSFEFDLFEAAQSLSLLTVGGAVFLLPPYGKASDTAQAP